MASQDGKDNDIWSETNYIDADKENMASFCFGDAGNGVGGVWALPKREKSHGTPYGTGNNGQTYRGGLCCTFCADMYALNRAGLNSARLNCGADDVDVTARAAIMFPDLAEEMAMVRIDEDGHRCSGHNDAVSMIQSCRHAHCTSSCVAFSFSLETDGSRFTRTKLEPVMRKRWRDMIELGSRGCAARPWKRRDLGDVKLAGH
jgi:hypothetical protein